jgi:type IV pilus assembly protein PilM
MIDKPESNRTLGLQMGQNTLKGAELCIKGRKPSLVFVFEIGVDLKHEAVSEKANPLEITEDGRRVSHLLEKDLAVTALHTNEVIVRPLEVKLTKLKDVDAVLAFQAEPLLPYLAEETLLDRVLLGKNKEGTELTLLATKNDYVEAHLAEWSHLGIEPEVISTTSAALTSFANFFHESDYPFFIINLGLTETSVVLVKEKKIIGAQSIPLNTHLLKEIFLKETEEALSTVEEFDSKRAPKTAEFIEKWELEITKTVFALQKQLKKEEFGDTLITGEGVEILGLVSKLTEKLAQSPVSPKKTDSFDLNEKELQKFAVAIGLALQAITGAQNQINFRQKEFSYPNPWKRLKKPLLTYLASALFLSLMFLFLSDKYLNLKEDVLKEKLLENVALSHRDYKEFEKNYLKKYPNRGLPQNLQELTLQQITSLNEFLDQQVKEQPESFPLQPNLPRVSDVLAWLTTHPNVVSKNESTGVVTPLISIENFHYTLLKRPDKQKKRERYQAKVDLEFTAESPKNAREFHDALITENPLVDLKNEVKWGVSQGKYRTSFILKDKTNYSQGGI